MIRYPIETADGQYAEFDIAQDGSAVLTRWPRIKSKAVVPENVEGHSVTAVAATAFAPFHIPEKLFEETFYTPYSINMLAMKLGSRVMRETEDEGGPSEIVLPETLTRIGAYAFWHCCNLKELRIPENVRKIAAGTFGECSRLEEIQMPENLMEIGFLPKLTDQIMPDIGAFYCCHELKTLTLPGKLRLLGAYSFNSCGIRVLRREGGSEEERAAGRAETKVHKTAFDHAAALQWMDQIGEKGEICYRIGLPPARDTILSADPLYGQLGHIPVDFFIKEVSWFDRLAKEAFRVDFSARMALGRLRYDENLSIEDRGWYTEVLVNYFGQAILFMPGKEDPYEQLFEFVEKLAQLKVDDLSRLIYTAGELRLPASLISRMIEVRTQRFSSVTGMEDLEIDF